MNAIDPNAGPCAGSAVAHAVLDADAALLSADPALHALHLRAGGSDGGPLAVPQLATIARLARRLGIVVSRRVTVADEDADIDLWVRAQPEGDRVRLAASGWSEQPAWRPGSTGTAAMPAGDWRWETDASLRLTFLSPDGTDGFDAFAQLGRPVTAVFAFDEAVGGGMPILDALARRRPFRDQPATLRPTGATVVLEAAIRGDPEGGFAGLVGSARAVDRADVGEKAMPHAFTAGLDRALRAPLARIVANADSISARADGPITDDYADYAADIASAGRHLLGLVDGLVDLQAIERPDFRPAADPIDLADVARRAAGLLAVRAERAGVAIARPAPDIVAPAIGDFGRTLQIMVNLVGNAVRYAPAGSAVAIDVLSEGDVAWATVSDRGHGIAPDDQERVFEKFERIDQSEPSGSGLGLFIARRLARAMGGDLTLRSAPGNGASFTVSLPARQAARE